jgi:hypothetical protein
MNVIITEKWYSCKECQLNPNMLFVFGDNERRMGMGGQAIIREEPNAIGLATKKSSAFFWSDDDLAKNKKVINQDINEIKKRYIKEGYKYLVLPKAGLGTGLSDLHRQAPRTFLYLTERLLDEFEFNNMLGLTSK